MPNPALVGLGHSGAQDYDTLDLWWATESAIDYGVPIEAQCLGNVGRFTPSGTSVNGAEIHTQSVQYDGTNDASLAVGDRFNLASGSATVSAPITIRDLHIGNSGQSFVACLSVVTDYVSLSRLRVKNVANNVNTLTVTQQLNNSSLANSVISGGIDEIAFNFETGLNISNVLLFGATTFGLDGAANFAYTIADSFSFNNSNDDIRNIITISNCATEDASGTYTGYTSAELVDFANDDFRTKSTSPLATLGTGGSFIGAFLESGGAASIVATITEQGPLFSETINAAVTGQIQATITELAPSFSEAITATVTPSDSIEATITESGPLFSEIINALISRDIEADITEQGPSFSESIQASISISISADIIESGPSFTESITVKLPTKWTDKPKVVTDWDDKAKVSTTWTDVV